MPIFQEFRAKHLAVIKEGKNVNQQINLLKIFCQLINNTSLKEIASNKVYLDENKKEEQQKSLKKSLDAFYKKWGQVAPEGEEKKQEWKTKKNQPKTSPRK